MALGNDGGNKPQMNAGAWGSEKVTHPRSREWPLGPRYGAGDGKHDVGRADAPGVDGADAPGGGLGSVGVVNVVPGLIG